MVEAGDVAVKEKDLKFEIVLSSFRTPNHVNFLSPFRFFALWTGNNKATTTIHTTLPTPGTTDGDLLRVRLGNGKMAMTKMGPNNAEHVCALGKCFFFFVFFDN
jgi:hypothetical protein